MLLKQKMNMKFFNLNKTKSSITFSLQSPESFLHIQEITLITNENIKNNLSNITSSIQLNYELLYIVFNESENRFTEIRKKSSIIPIDINPYHTHPVFLLDLKIKNESFTIGINTIHKWFTALKIELSETRSTNSEYELKFDIESNHIKEQTALPH